MSTNVAAADTQMAAAGLPSGSMSHPAGASAAPGGATVLQLTMAKMSAKLLTFQEKHTAELFDILTKGNRALDASSMGCGKVSSIEHFVKRFRTVCVVDTVLL